MVDDSSNDDELFSMDDLEKDLKKGRPPKRLPWFSAGLLLGIAGTILIPIFAAPYLPAFFQGDREILSGPVLAKERDGDRLLLTIQTEPGALIASFSERVSEIGLLVDTGDIVTIAVDDYDPFIADPDFEGVKKATAPEGSEPAGDTETDAGAAGDAENATDESATDGTSSEPTAEVEEAATAGENAAEPDTSGVAGGF